MHHYTSDSGKKKMVLLRNGDIGFSVYLEVCRVNVLEDDVPRVLVVEDPGNRLHQAHPGFAE